MSSSEDQIALMSQRLGALSSTRSQSLSTVKSHLSHDIDSISTEIKHHISDKLNQNRDQILLAVADLASSIQASLSNDLLSMFTSFAESLQDGDFEALDLSNWINDTLSLFEKRFGALAVDQDRILAIVNDFTMTWSNKIEGLKSSRNYLTLPEGSGRGQEDDDSRGREFSREGRDKNDRRSESVKADARDVSKSERRSPSVSDKKGGLLSRMTGLFKAERSQSNTAEGPKVINLGKEKNFRWDAVKKRYVFDDDDEEEEEQEDHGPPLPKFASEQVIKKIDKDPSETESHTSSLVQPPKHRALDKKKAPSGKGPVEAKRPAFIPSAPAIGAEEEKWSSRASKKEYTQDSNGDVLEEIRRRIDEIFDQSVEEVVVVKGLGRLRRDIKALDEVSGPGYNEEIAREAKFLVMESELESTQVSIIRESYSRKLLEAELASLRESYQMSFEKEFSLSESVKELERDLAMYKDVYSVKSQVSSTVTTTQMQQKMLENFLQNLKETSVEKKKTIETANQLRETELELQEVKAALRVAQAKYEQVVEFQRDKNSTNGQLKSLLEDSYKAQREQDKLIIQQKEENLGLVKKCRELYAVIGQAQGEKEKMKGYLKGNDERIGELEAVVRELEGGLNEAKEKIEEYEREHERNRREIEMHLGSIQEINDEKEEIRRGLQEEQRYRAEVEERLQETEAGREQWEKQAQELETVKSRLEEMLQNEEAYRKDTEQRLLEETEERRKAEEEIEAMKERFERLGEEKEDVVRRLEEEIEEGRRLKIQVDEYERELKNALEMKDQAEREVRREREQMMEELLEHRGKSQVTTQEKELLSKFSEELSQSNIGLEERVQALTLEVSKLNTEKEKSIEAVLQFVREMKSVVSEASEIELVEGYVAELLQTHVDVSEHYFRAIGALPKIRDSIIRELEAERTRNNLELENLTSQLNNYEKERIYLEDQQRLVLEESQRLKEIIDGNNEQAQQFEMKGQEMAAEIERLRGEVEVQMQQNLNLERVLQQREFELGENLRLLGENQQHQNLALEGFEGQIRQLNDLKEEIFRLQAGLEEEKTRGAQMNLVRAEFEEQIRVLKEENAELQQQIDEGFEQYTFLQNKAKEMFEQLKAAKDENTHLKSHQQELEEANRNITAKLESQAASLQQENQQYQSEQVELVKAQFEEQIKALKEENADLQQQIDEGFEQYTFLQNKAKGILEELKAAKDENARLKSHQQGLEDANKNITSSLDAQTGNTATIHEQAAAIESLQAEKNALAQQVAELSEKLEILGRELSNKDTGSSEEVIALNQRIEALTQELQGSKQPASNDVVEELNEKIRVLSQELQSKEGLANYVSTLLEDNSKLAQELTEKNVVINQLREDIELAQQTATNNTVQKLESTQADNSVNATEFEAFREEALLSIRTLTGERDQALGVLQVLQTERDEALAALGAIQAREKETLSRIEMMQLENNDLVSRLQEEETRTYSLNAVLEETQGNKESIESVQKELERRVNGLEQDKFRLGEELDGALRERDDLRRENRELQAMLEQREQGTGESRVGGEELWGEIEREYGDSKVMEYLQSVKTKMGIEKDISGVKLIGVLLKEFEEAIGDVSRGLEEKEATVIGLTRSLDDMNEQYQKLQNQVAMMEGEQSGKEDYSSIRELYEKKTKRVEELLKEISTKSGQMDQMKKTIDEQAKLLEESMEGRGRGEGGEGEGLNKEEIEVLKQEIEKEREKCAKVTEEFENYKKKYKNNSEERGAIQHSYSQIIKNLSMQLDEVRKKKGLPIATMVTKTTQTGEEEKKVVTSPVEEPVKKGFLSGMAKFFLTDTEVKKI